MAGRTAAVITLLVSALLLVIVLPGYATGSVAAPHRTAEPSQSLAENRGPAPEEERDSVPSRQGGSVVLRISDHRHPLAPSSRRQFSQLVTVVTSARAALRAYVTTGGGLLPGAGQPSAHVILQVFRC